MKYYVILICWLVLGAACQSTPETYTLTGNIKGLSEGMKLVLKPGATHKGEKPVAETIVTNGKFEFSGVLETPRLFYLSVEEYPGAEPVMLENGKAEISGFFRLEGHDGQQVAVFQDCKVKGSAVHDLFLQKVSVRDELDQEHKAFNERNQTASWELGRLRTIGNRDSIRLFMEGEGYQKLVAEEKAFFDLVERRYRETIVSNKDSWWGPFLMMYLFNYFTPDLKPWYEELSPEAKDSYYGQLVKTELFPETLEGKIAAEFSAPDKEGKMLTLKELLQGKKYLLVDFWASWCGPCRRSIPQMKVLYEQYKDQGLGMVGVSWDKDGAAWKKALQEEQMPWNNLLGNDDIFNAYGVQTIPSVFIIDTSGKIQGAKLHGEELVNKLKQLFPAEK